jgi:DNA-binding transcriptional regulator YbjK
VVHIVVAVILMVNNISSHNNMNHSSVKHQTVMVNNMNHSSVKHQTVMVNNITSYNNMSHIDHNPSWKENQRKRRESLLDPRVMNITSGGHTQKGLNLLLFNFLTSAWSLASW